MVDNARHLGYLPAFRLIGLLELSGSAGLLIGLNWAPLAAAAGLVLLTLGAVITHLRRKDPVKVAAPAVLYFVASVAVLVLPSDHRLTGRLRCARLGSPLAHATWQLHRGASVSFR